jgi:hypothetical protein
MPSVADNSFLLFVYPFLFDANSFDSRVKAFDDAKWGDPNKKKQFSLWTAGRFPGTDMLAYVANYLNPKANAPATARLWKLNEELQEAFGLAGRADWQMIVGKDELPFQLGELGKTTFAFQLAMFRVGTGFLTVRVQPRSSELDDWLDALSYFRFIRGQRNVGLCARKRIGFDTATQQPQFAPFFPTPTEASGDNGCGRYGDVVSALLGAAALSNESSPWWNEVFVSGQALPFASLFVDDLPKGDIPSLIYRLRNFFTSRQEIHPSEADLRPEHPSLLPYIDNQWFIFSLDGGVFLAADAPQTEFFRRTLPEHIRDHYFLLFLLALHQRFTLMNLSQQVSEHWLEPDEEVRTRAFERIRETMLEFMARGRFAQVMQQEHHHSCYRRWLRTFQVHELSEEVRSEIAEMHDYLQGIRERESQERLQHLEHRISSLAVLIGIPTLVSAFLVLVPGGLQLRYSFAIVGAALLVGFVLLLVLQKRGER